MFMRILLAIQGNYGQRMVDNIRRNSPEGWIVNSFTLPQTLPMIVDEPKDFLPSELPATDLLISLGEQPGVAQLIPDIVEKTGTKAVIAPADNRDWLPQGLARQIIKKLAEVNVDMVYPVTFCTLTETASYNPYILEFAQHFGKPGVNINLEGDEIRKVTIVRETPCGNTRFVAQGLIGVKVSEAVEQAGLLFHQHPCLASMAMDAEFGDTLMHRAGFMTKSAVDSAIKEKLGERRF